MVYENLRRRSVMLLLPVVTILMLFGYSEAAERDDYVILTGAEDTAPERISQKYLKGVDCWEEIIQYNLLMPERYIALPPHLLAPGRIPAKITFVNGDVRLKRTFEDRRISVITDMLIIEGDSIQTGPRAGVEIRQEDGTRIVIRSNSETRISDLSRDAADTRAVAIELHDGRLEAMVEKLKTRDSRFEIKTPTAVSFIRGTNFRVKVEEEGFSRIEVLDGQVEVTAQGKDISVDSNQGTSIRAGEPPCKPVILLDPPAELVEPADHEVLKAEPRIVTLKWSPVKKAQAYHVMIAGDPYFNEVIEESDIITEPTFSFRMPRYGTYFWHVSSIDKDGFEGQSSQYRYFVYPLTRRF